MPTATATLMAPLLVERIPTKRLTGPTRCSLCGEALTEYGYILPMTSSSADFTCFAGIADQPEFWGCHDCAALLTIYYQPQTDLILALAEATSKIKSVKSTIESAIKSATRRKQDPILPSDKDRIITELSAIIEPTVKSLDAAKSAVTKAHQTQKAAAKEPTDSNLKKARDAADFQPVVVVATDHLANAIIAIRALRAQYHITAGAMLMDKADATLIALPGAKNVVSRIAESTAMGWHRAIQGEPVENILWKEYFADEHAWEHLHDAIFEPRAQVWEAMITSSKRNLAVYLPYTPAHSRYVHILTEAPVGKKGGMPFIAVANRQALWSALVYAGETVAKNVAQGIAKDMAANKKPPDYAETVRKVVHGTWRGGAALAADLSPWIPGDYDVQRLVQVLLPAVPLLTYEQACGLDTQNTAQSMEVITQ